MSRHTSLRALTGAFALAAVASCSHLGTEVLGEHAARGEMFDNYVAIGNSITAGFQAGGLTETTQRAAFPVLLARSMGTRMNLPIMAGRGCNPPVSNFATQAGPTGVSAAARPTICDLRNAAFSFDVLNNVGVPGARVTDPTVSTSANSNTLTQLILGGKSQVRRAIEANATFVSIWIGNNDVLGPAVSPSTTTGLTTSIDAIIDSATFAASYNRMLDSLTMFNPDIKGVLIGVANVTALPLLFAGSLMTGSFKAEFDAIACGATPPAGSAFPGCFGVGTTVVPGSCTGSTALINLGLAFAIVRGQHPPTISCVAGGGIGDFMVLSPAEQTTITTRITAFNNHISSRATALGFAYFDPNNTTNGLPALRSDTTGSLIRIRPAPTSATNPFGTGMSFDGVHPGTTLHVRIANSLIAVINAKYGTTLPNAQ